MKKNFLTFLFLLLALIIMGCAKEETVSHTSDATKPVKKITITSYPSDMKKIEEFLDEPENLQYYGANLAVDYPYGEYIFQRYKTFLTISKEGNEGKSLTISGNHFVLTDNKLWFITEPDREISVINYKNIDFSKEVDVNSYITTYMNYDLYNERDLASYEKFKYNKKLEVKTKTMINGYEIPYTVLIDGQKIFAIQNSKEIDYCEIPSQIRELIYTNIKNKDENILRVTYKTYSEIIGVLEFSEYGIKNTVIDESSDQKELMYINKDTNICTQGNWVIYKKNGKTVASDGGLVCDMDSLPDKEMAIGDSWGIGRGSDSAAISTDSEEK